MNGRTFGLSLCAAVVSLPLAGLVAPDLGAQSAANRFWGQWRGPAATGVSRTATPPTEWSETRNVRWKAPIPGRSSSSPVVWGDKVFLLTAVPVDAATVAGLAPRGSVPPQTPHKFVVMALGTHRP
jgi:outer membrane protein assembly factor BamB